MVGRQQSSRGHPVAGCLKHLCHTQVLGPGMITPSPVMTAALEQGPRVRTGELLQPPAAVVGAPELFLAHSRIPRGAVPREQGAPPSA